MLIKVNGKDENLIDDLTLAGLISVKGLCAQRIVIEHNFNIVPKSQWEKVLLKDNDTVEIISFVGGG